MSQPHIHFEPEPGSSSAMHTITVPRVPLYTAGAIVLLTLGIAFGATRFGWFKDPDPVVAALEERRYVFADLPDGGIRVTDAQRGLAVAGDLSPQSFNFLRGALRALSRQRRLGGIGAEVPFRLVRYADGRIVLEDSTTRSTVVVTSFGPNQIAEFERLFALPKPTVSAAVPTAPAPGSQ